MKWRQRCGFANPSNIWLHDELYWFSVRTG